MSMSFLGIVRMLSQKANVGLFWESFLLEGCHISPATPKSAGVLRGQVLNLDDFYLAGGFNPRKKISVSGDCYSQHMET